MPRALRWVGLGLVAGAALLRPLGAQVRDTIPKRPDSTKIVVPAKPDSLADSLAKRDTTPPAKRDTIKAPLAHAELPVDIDVGRRFHWSGDSLRATGAVAVADLLERVPGLTMMHAGWISAPAVGAYLGDIRRVRVFYDGVELAPLDPRARGSLDLTQVNLWSAEDASIEQEPEEVRVYLRSWRIVNTTPYTRVDMSTGDQQTNLYRGFYGQRLDNGMAIQFGAQQYGTTPPSSFGTSSDQLGLIARIGWAKKDWSVDAFSTRVSRHRGGIFGEAAGDSLRSVESARTYSYVRGGYGDPDASPFWGQLMAVASKYGYTGVRTVPTTNLKTAAESALAVTSLDTSSYQTQYIGAVGMARGPLRGSVTQRLFLAGGHNIASTALRASFVTDRLSVSAFTQGKSADSLERSDVTAQITPLSFLTVLAGGGRSSEHRLGDTTFSANYLRAQVGLRVHNLWFLGGVIRRDSVTLSAPRIFDTLFAARREPLANGVTAAIRGQVWRLINADISAVRWADSLGYYRPRYQTRSELFIQSAFLRRFPTNNFGLKTSIVHEYRSGVRFPVRASSVFTTAGYRTISTLLEIRIMTATLTWQFKNFLGERYSQVPTFIMPRQTNFYGVRWEFVN